MPELPEVETIKRDLEKNIIGHKVIDVWYDWAKTLKPDPETFEKAVVGKKFKDINRRAKLFIFHLDSVPMVVHLKMTGRLLYRDQSDPKDQFTHAIFKLDKGKELRFADLRKFGWLKVLKDEKELENLLSEFGPEPLTEEFTLKVFENIIKKSQLKIKPLLIDQKRIAGVGNIYADESLWCAKIHPETKADKILSDQVAKLYKCIEEVLKEGIKDRGTSVDQYLDLFGRKGSHEQNLKVFRLNGDPCPRCGTIIKKIRVGGRGTHVCPACQRL
ncbi:MAG: DNA-formamidopyrimidine glycosylase [Candidatus Woykebacteria bacterium RBG_13_40_7b]|uniref:Formamidopyrimidine-DNA glycosylase n=1 Tax=Candidatus Woykebacteria bacterium RBG_13_40_7b TaxID=1802594 RepID=A0A1G1W6S1_9BACT|nr:MAG: DNA-formamidopyrimidine glycosylase [Candidatus Woykebacteria bacterium RBG_13_40_7b]